MPKPRIAIVGAGFAGLQAARGLRAAAAEVILIDAQPYQAFVPLFYQVATALLPPARVQFSLSRLARRQANLQVRQAAVTALDLERRQLHLTDGQLNYDYLVLATGSRAEPAKLPGAAEHALPLASLADAVTLRNQILNCWTQAAREPDPDQRQRLLTVALVGGGPTGVELAGGLQELWRGTLQRRYPSLRQERLRLLLLQAGDRLLDLWPESLSHYTAQHLSQLDVEVRCDTRVAVVQPQSVQLATGEAIAAATVVWTGGLVANQPATQPAVPPARKLQWSVEPTLQVPNAPAVYAVGDLAYLEADNCPLPSVAPVAIQMGAWAARNIQQQLRGRSPQPFTYQDKGRAAIIARYAGIVKTTQLSLHGWSGWLLWLAIHVCYLPGWRNRGAVLAAWLGDLWGRPRSLQRFSPQPYRTPLSAAVKSTATD